MFLSLVWQRFHLAIRLLAIGEGGINERMTNAFIKQLMDLEIEDLPDDMRSDFEAIYSEVTRVKAGTKEEIISASIKEMDPEEVSKIAIQIFNLFDVVTQKYFLNGESK